MQENDRRKEQNPWVIQIGIATPYAKESGLTNYLIEHGYSDGILISVGAMIAAKPEEREALFNKFEERYSQRPGKEKLKALVKETIALADKKKEEEEKRKKEKDKLEHYM
jgi:hypothetical protein